MTKLHRLALMAAILLPLTLMGCHNECATDEDCFAGFVCIGSSVCPDDVQCFWEGEPGTCGLPAERSCRVTGGTWDENSCGNYECGEFPACDAIVPGCDCGPKANFVEGKGCVEDQVCAGNCDWDGDCPEGEICGGLPFCPPNVRCAAPEPTDWGTCVEGCWSDIDCPRGEVCDGAIICPPGALCLLADSPGLCVEDLPAHERKLCEATGGRWDPAACGHRRCESDIQCLAIIPGCDCGSTANFDPELGCVTEPTCANP